MPEPPGGDAAEVFANDVLPMNRASPQFAAEFSIAGNPVGRSFRALLPEAMGNRFTGWLCSHATKAGPRPSLSLRLQSRPEMVPRRAALRNSSLDVGSAT